MEQQSKGAAVIASVRSMLMVFFPSSSSCVLWWVCGFVANGSTNWGPLRLPLPCGVAAFSDHTGLHPHNTMISDGSKSRLGIDSTLTRHFLADSYSILLDESRLGLDRARLFKTRTRSDSTFSGSTHHYRAT